MQTLFDLILSLLTGVAGVAWVDKDNRQIDDYETKPAVPLPCILFKIAITSAETISEGVQLCIGSITTRSVTDLSVIETSAAAAQDARDRSNQFYNIDDGIYTILQSYTDATIETIEQVSTIEETRKDGLQVIKSVYSVIFQRIVN